jgi:hypothetical protein
VYWRWKANQLTHGYNDAAIRIKVARSRVVTKHFSTSPAFSQRAHRFLVRPFVGTIIFEARKEMKHHAAPSEPKQTPSLRSSGNVSIDTATLELLRRWRIEDATQDAEEIRAAEKEIADFKRAMNENRTTAGESLLYP